MQKVVEFEPKEGINTKSHRKDTLDNGYKIITVRPDGSGIYELVDCRIYHKPSRTYCCVWIAHNDIYASGSDYAGGYGYHRASAAVEKALKSAGIKLSQRIGGVGDEAVEQALLAVARHLAGDIPVHIIRCHP